MEEPKNINLIKKIDQPFSWCPNEIVNDPNISFKAKGIWLYMNGKPEGWKFSAERIAKETKDERKSILSGLKELKDAGYLEYYRKGDGSVEYTLIYEVFHNPKSQNGIEGNEPKSQNGTVPKRHGAEMGLYNNKEDNKEILKERKSDTEQKTNTGSPDAGLAGNVPASILKMNRSHYMDDEKFEKDFYERNTVHLTAA